MELGLRGGGVRKTSIVLTTLENNKNNSHQSVCPIKSTANKGLFFGTILRLKPRGRGSLSLPAHRSAANLIV